MALVGSAGCSSDDSASPQGGSGGSSSGTGGASTGGSSGTGGSGTTGGSGGSGDTGGSQGSGGSTTGSGSAFQVDGVATWRNNAKGAYTIIHDDTCDSSAAGEFAHADPELFKRGLHAGFGTNPNTCNEENRWDDVKTMVAHGHDVFNHTWDHACIGSSGACNGNGTFSSDLAKEIDQASDLIKEQTGLTPQYFIFPYDVCGATPIEHLKSKGYLGARCGDHGINATDFPDAFETKFDVWGPNWSIYLDEGPCAGKTQPDQDTDPKNIDADCRMYVMNHYVDETISQGGWGNREMHGFEGDGGAFQPITVADYAAHLDYVKTKIDAGDLWMEGPTQVVKYRFAREKCDKPTLSGSTLTFGTPSADCQTYATVLSYLVSTTDGSDPASLKVVQGGATLPARKLSAGKFVVDADPTKGDAVISE
jgi:hypothetical protein